MSEKMEMLYKTTYDGTGAKKAKDDIKSVSSETQTMGKNMNLAFTGIKWAVLGHAIKKVGGFIADVTKQSADYIETLNLLDVAFQNNTESIRKFSSNLADTLNLDDSTVLRSAAHFKVLSQSMGLANETGEKLAELMTQMTLDVSSLYNMDFDKAQRALQYAMEGRGTSLKQNTGVSVLETSVQTTMDVLGIDAYVEDMNDAEKAIARVISMEYQLMSSQGDLARTIEAPANQFRVLKEQVTMLARNIGNVLLPVVAKILPYLNAIFIVLNAIISALARLVGYSEGMFDMFGDEDAGGIDYFEDLGGAIDGVGNSAADAAKKMQGLRNFDKLNVIKTPTESGGGGGGGAVGGAGGINPKLLDAFSKMADLYDAKLEGVKTKATQIAETILHWLGFQERVNEETGKTEWYFAGIQGKATKLGEHLSNIGKTLEEIFTNPGVLNAASKWFDSFTHYSGMMVNSVAKIGSSIAENLVGSIDKYLSQNKDRIKMFLASMFTISAKDFRLAGLLSNAFAEVYSVLENDIAKQIGADIIAMFVNPFMSITQLLSQWVTDFSEIFIYPIITNIEEIKATFEGLLEPIQTFTGTLSEAFSYIGDTVNTLYNEHFKPFYDDMKKNLGDTFAKFLEVYNTYFAPFIKETADDLKVLWDNHLKPLWDNISEFVGWIVDNIRQMWNQVLKPVVDWVVQNILPLIVPVLTTIKNTIFNAIALIADVIGSVIQVIKGVIDFVAGVFTGDWKRAWNGVVSIFKGIIDGLIGIFKYPLNTIIDAINNFTRELSNKVKIPDWVPGVGGKSLNIPRIQKLASGGMPDVGQMFIANEKGPELVGQIGGQSFVANQNQMMDLIDKKLQGGGLNNATFVIQVGDKEIAKQVITDLQDMAKDNGKPIVIGG